MSESEATRLEALWMGDFGNAYVDRNQTTGEAERPFWQEVLQLLPVTRVLEVGCNIGANLRPLSELLPPHEVYGIDINRKALREIRMALPEANLVWARARELPFRDRMFDLVFTMGVLIHQPSDQLPIVMSEIVRCSRRYVICGEYYAPEPAEIPYRGIEGALFKRDYGALYQQLFPELQLIRQGFLPKGEAWDDLTYWIFAKP